MLKTVNSKTSPPVTENQPSAVSHSRIEDGYFSYSSIRSMGTKIESWVRRLIDWALSFFYSKKKEAPTVQKPENQELIELVSQTAGYIYPENRGEALKMFTQTIDASKDINVPGLLRRLIEYCYYPGWKELIQKVLDRKPVPRLLNSALISAMTYGNRNAHQEAFAEVAKMLIDAGADATITVNVASQETAAQRLEAWQKAKGGPVDERSLEWLRGNKK